VGVKLQLPNTANPRDAITSGAVVRSVVPGSPAARAGLRPGDLIVSAGGRRLHNPFDWEAELLDLRVGQHVSLHIKRGVAESDVTVTVADLPEVSAAKVQVLKELELVTLTPAIRVQNGIRSPNGALIYRVSDRVAEDLGFQTGDVIVQVNRTPITTANEAAQAITYYGGRGPIRVFFEHAGRVYSTDFQLQ
jgi:serine protease Do